MNEHIKWLEDFFNNLLTYNILLRLGLQNRNFVIPIEAKYRTLESG
jgi:hypothetical protein